MDVTPFGKQSVILSSSQARTPVADRGHMVKNSNQGLPMSSESTDPLADPVKRAEEAIGGLFTDSRFPSGRFSIDHDEESGRYVYRLIDQETDEILKQFPGDYVLRRVAYYRELQGLAVNSEV